MESFSPKLSLRDLTDDSLGDIFAQLPPDSRLTVKSLCRKGRDIGRDPVSWSTINLQGVRRCCISVSPDALSRVLRYIALAVPAAVPGSPPPVSRLRCLALELGYSDRFSAVKEVGRHHAAAQVRELEIDVDVGSAFGDINFYEGRSCISTTQALDLWPSSPGSALFFPSLVHLRVNRLLIEVGVELPPQNANPDPFLAACARMVDLLRDRSIATKECVCFKGAGFGGETIEMAHPVDGGRVRALLGGLCSLLDAVHDSVLPRASKRPSFGFEISFDCEFIAWDDPSLWGAVSRLAQGVPRISIEETIATPETSLHIRFGGPAVAPKLISAAGPVKFFGTDQRVYTSSPAAYKHYLHNLARVIDGAPSLSALWVKSDRFDIETTGHVDFNPVWPTVAAEGLATLLLSLGRGNNHSLKELYLTGFYGRRLSFPAPSGGSWMEPGANSFARAYLALLESNRSIEKVTFGNLVEWCKRFPKNKAHPNRQPTLPSNAAAIFSRSVITHFALEGITLHRSDGPFFAAAIAHSRRLVCLRLSGCALNDRLAKKIAAALCSPSSLRELLIEDHRPYMTDAGVIAFADAIPKCSLTALSIELSSVDGLDNKEIDFYDVDITPTGLGAVLRGLEENVTLRRLVVSPVSPVKSLIEDLDGGDPAAQNMNEGVDTSLLKGITLELGINSNPEQRACATDN